MSTKLFVALARLVRLDTSILTACIVFVPLGFKGYDFAIAAQRALPVLLMSMCCFVINDIHDLEKDRTNHPTRPIPTGIITEKVAMAIYLVLLFCTLLSIYAFISLNSYYIYLFSLIIFTNYNYIVSEFPYLKNFYVAFASILPVLILRPETANVTIYDILAVAMAFFIYGRELLMDVQDLEGDGQTFVQKVGQTAAIRIAFFSQLLTPIILASIALNLEQWLAVTFLFISVLVVIVLWHIRVNRLFLIHVMKVQAISGLVFLF